MPSVMGLQLDGGRGSHGGCVGGGAVGGLASRRLWEFMGCL